MALYNWVSTTKWTGRQEVRSWVAGLHVSQDRALYCSKTNLKTSDVVLESRGCGTRCEFLAGRSSSVCATEMWWCSEAWQKNKDSYLPGPVDHGAEQRQAPVCQEQMLLKSLEVKASTSLWIVSCSVTPMWSHITPHPRAEKKASTVND